MQKIETVPVITLDGPSGTGKGTLCHLLANHLAWHVLDSGCIYRALAYAARHKNINFQDLEKLVALAHALDLRFESAENAEIRVLLEDEDVFEALRTEACGQDASRIAVIPEIRKALLQRQRDFAKAPGLVTDGRDMGTVVFPDAFLKIYLFANDNVRAQRRFFQLKEKGIDVTLAQVIDELSQRDARDRSRAHSPLEPAEDAIVLDTSYLNINQVFEAVLKLINNAMNDL